MRVAHSLGMPSALISFLCPLGNALLVQTTNIFFLLAALDAGNPVTSSLLSSVPILLNSTVCADQSHLWLSPNLLSQFRCTHYFYNTGRQADRQTHIHQTFVWFDLKSFPFNNSGETGMYVLEITVTDCTF